MKKEDPEYGEDDSDFSESSSYDDSFKKEKREEESSNEAKPLALEKPESPEMSEVDDLKRELSEEEPLERCLSPT